MVEVTTRPLKRTLTVKEIQEIAKIEQTQYLYVEKIKTAGFDDFVKLLDYKNKVEDQMNVQVRKMLLECYALSPEELDKLQPAEYFPMWTELVESSNGRKNSTTPSTTPSAGASGTA